MCFDRGSHLHITLIHLFMSLILSNATRCFSTASLTDKLWFKDLICVHSLHP